MAVGEDGLDPLPDPTVRDAAKKGERVVHVVLEDAARVAVGEHAVHVLPASKGAGLLAVGEGAPLVEGGVDPDPARGDGAERDAEHGASAGSDAAEALDDLDRLEGRVESLERAGAGMPVEPLPGRCRPGAPCQVALLVHRPLPWATTSGTHRALVMSELVPLHHPRWKSPLQKASPPPSRCSAAEDSSDCRRRRCTDLQQMRRTSWRSGASSR